MEEAAPAKEEVPTEAAEAPPVKEEPAAVPSPLLRTDEPLDELGGISLDELLEDIRNM